MSTHAIPSTVFKTDIFLWRIGDDMNRTISEISDLGFGNGIGGFLDTGFGLI